MIKKLSLIGLLSYLCLHACAATHPDCERADAFGHCQQWKNQPNPCAKPDFLGFCPPPKA